MRISCQKTFVEGHSWSIKAGKSNSTKRQTRANNHDDPQIPQPDLRFVKRKQQTRQKTGQGPNKQQPQKGFAKGHSGFTTVPLHKSLQNELSTATFRET